MIREDRLQLNERFIKVFNLLEERGEIVLNDRGGKGMGDFAEKILGNRSYGHIIRAYLNEDDKRVISYSQARSLCREYGVSETYMLDGVGSPFGIDLPRVYNEEAFQTGNILFTSAEAFAGSALDVGGHREDLAYFSVPGLSGPGMVAFPIKGNSMEPIIQNGDIVVCRQIESVNDVKDNELYAVKSNGSLWIKFVQRILHGGRVTHLKLISANHLEHDPFVEEVNIHTRLYKVVRRISDL